VDIERTAEVADPAIAASGVVAFPRDVGGIERLIIAAEIRRDVDKATRSGGAGEIDEEGIIRRIRAAVAAEHEVTPHEVVLLKPGALPRTTSGKLSHRATHDAFAADTLERLSQSHVHAAR
jgi:acyl-coenzyme A synthetase/AMP-(fatty) acid ligase